MTEDEEKIFAIINRFWEEEKGDLVWDWVRGDCFPFEELNVNPEEVDVNYLRTPTGYTVLMGRVEANDFEGCKAYLNRGAKVDARYVEDKEEETALILAVKYNLADIVELLIEHGANVNYEGNHHNSVTPLIYAIRNNKKEMAELLLKHGASIHIERKWEQDQWWKDALLAAIGKDSKELVELLIKYGADVNRPDPSPLWFAIYHDHEEIAEFLINHGAHLTREALGAVVRRGYPKLLEIFLRKGVDIDIRVEDEDKEGNKKYKTLLDIAEEEEIKDMLMNPDRYNSKYTKPGHFKSSGVSVLNLVIVLAFVIPFSIFLILGRHYVTTIMIMLSLIPCIINFFTKKKVLLYLSFIFLGIASFLPSIWLGYDTWDYMGAIVFPLLDIGIILLLIPGIFEKILGDDERTLSTNFLLFGICAGLAGILSFLKILFCRIL